MCPASPGHGNKGLEEQRSSNQHTYSIISNKRKYLHTLTVAALNLICDACGVPVLSMIWLLSKNLSTQNVFFSSRKIVTMPCSPLSFKTTKLFFSHRRQKRKLFGNIIFPLWGSSFIYLMKCCNSVNWRLGAQLCLLIGTRHLPSQN